MLLYLSDATVHKLVDRIDAFTNDSIITADDLLKKKIDNLHEHKS